MADLITTEPRHVDIECPTMAAAERIRREWGDCVVDHADDKRSRTVTVSGWARDVWLDEMGAIAQRARERLEDRYGQIPLTQHERDRLDFERTNVFHARSCKAIARGEGVDDWLARYDPTLSVDEHRGLYQLNGRTGPTMREVGAGRVV